MMNDYSVNAEMADEPFAHYVRMQVLHLLSANGAPRRTLDVQDRDCLEATSRYLQSEGEAPLLMADIKDVPTDLHRRLADAFESRALTRAPTPFYTAPDTQQRAASRSRNQALADWTAALWRYYAQCEQLSPDAPEHIRLWKQEFRQAPDGTMQPHIVEVDHIDPADHAIVGFNGVAGMHRAQPALHGFFEQMAQVLGGDLATLTPHNGKKLVLYAASYPDAHRIRYAQEIPAFNADPEHYVSDKARIFTHQVVLPWLGLHEGQPLLKPADLQAQLRRMNLFLFSYGACIGKEIRNELASWLKEQGYNPAMIRQAFAEVYAMHIHPVCRLDESPEYGNFSSLYVASRSDVQSRARAGHDRFIPPSSEPPALVPISDNELLVWLDHPTQNITWANPDVAEQFNEAGPAGSNPKRIEGLAGLGSGHSLRMATQAYEFIGKDGLPQRYHPGYLGNSLRSVVAATVVPKDLSQTLEAPEPVHDGLQPIPSSFRLKEAIRRYQQEKQGLQQEPRRE